MKWTTIQKDGEIRTLDTNKDGLWDFFIEWRAMRKENPKEGKKKLKREYHLNEKQRRNLLIAAAIIILLTLVIT